ncbi:hypothetical protein [Streptomyces virginiae]|uniref:hypothetical protein n=1 Tax=Streptomyces virginiae TaxID=1961 RepID=UPI00224FB4F7|nr:hypothetical protein [Streptomyces virginiae]MCX4718755.1 hypothetical protein [Streptomyces virginiae]MCX5276394.1 hypothetical protein [Streptomyces virginiae]
MKDPFSSAEVSTLFALVGFVDRGAARRAVAERATDRADLERLIDMLGLWPDDDPPVPGTASTPVEREPGRTEPAG